jgi:hypothetical protein
MRHAANVPHVSYQLYSKGTPVTEIILADMGEWLDFVRENIDAIRDAYGSVSNAYQHAVQGGLMLGGGAAPLFVIRFAEEKAP